MHLRGPPRPSEKTLRSSARLPRLAGEWPSLCSAEGAGRAQRGRDASRPVRLEPQSLERAVRVQSSRQGQTPGAAPWPPATDPGSPPAAPAPAQPTRALPGQEASPPSVPQTSSCSFGFRFAVTSLGFVPPTPRRGHSAERPLHAPAPLRSTLDPEVLLKAPHEDARQRRVPCSEAHASPEVPAPGELDPGPRRPPARGEHTLLAQ